MNPLARLFVVVALVFLAPGVARAESPPRVSAPPLGVGASLLNAPRFVGQKVWNASNRVAEGVKMAAIKSQARRDARIASTGGDGVKKQLPANYKLTTTRKATLRGVPTRLDSTRTFERDADGNLTEVQHTVAAVRPGRNRMNNARAAYGRVPGYNMTDDLVGAVRIKRTVGDNPEAPGTANLETAPAAGTGSTGWTTQAFKFRTSFFTPTVKQKDLGTSEAMPKINLTNGTVTIQHRDGAVTEHPITQKPKK